MAKAKTFLDGETIQVDIHSVAPSSTGLLIVSNPEHGRYVRHVSKLEPLDEEAAEILRMDWKPKEN